MPVVQEIKSTTNETNEKYIDEFIDNNNQILTKERFQKIKIQKDKKTYSFNELAETKQKIIEILLYKQMMTKTEEFIKSNNIKIENHKNLDNFYKKIESDVANNKNALYKLYGASLHPLDKDFLDTLK